MKKCNKCSEVKVLSEFSKHKGACKSCCAKYQREYRLKNLERISQYNRQYLKQYSQENKKLKNERDRQYYKENSERIKKQTKRYYRENLEKVKKRKKEYRKQYNQSERGREANFQYNLKRRSKKHNVIFTPLQRKRLLDRDNWTCQSCGIKVHDRHTGDWNTPDKAHVDHIIPISRGGKSEPKNLRVLCRTCNLSKHNNQDTQITLNF